MYYTLHQLQVFLKVSELQSITKASEELHLTQPAVSIQLKKFQEQFSIPLTEVVGRQLYVTDFGKEIAQSAERVLNEIQDLNYKTLAFQGQVAGRLRISVVSTGKYVMPYFLSGFLANHPGVELSMDVTNKARVIQSLEQNEVDFALVSVVPDGLNTDDIQLLKNKLFLIGGTVLEQPSVRRRKHIFETHPMIYREPGSATRNAMESFIKEQDLPTYKKIELTSNEALKQAVIAGLGYSIMPLIGIKNELKNGDLRIIPFKGLPLTTHWNLIWKRSKKHGPAALAYLDYLDKEKSNIVKDQFDWYENY